MEVEGKELDIAMAFFRLGEKVRPRLEEHKARGIKDRLPSQQDAKPEFTTLKDVLRSQEISKINIPTISNECPES